MAINFHFEGNFKLHGKKEYADWLDRVLSSEGKTAYELDYVFCNDEYLAEINLKYLGHDTYTDIVTFDYSDTGTLKGDVFISTDRVRENAKLFEVPFEEELMRVMAHGVLHLVGYNDKTDEDRKEMRVRENEKIQMFHVEP